MIQDFEAASRFVLRPQGTDMFVPQFACVISEEGEHSGWPMVMLNIATINRPWSEFLLQVWTEHKVLRGKFVQSPGNGLPHVTDRDQISSCATPGTAPLHSGTTTQLARGEQMNDLE